MKLHNILQLVFVFCIFVPAAYGQQGVYFKIGGGYSFPLASYSIGTNTKNVYLRETDPETGNYIPALIHENSEVNGSYSTGVTGSLSVGYRVTEIIAVEVNGTYIHGKEYKSSSISEDRIDDEVVLFSRGKSTSRASLMLLAPTLIFTAPGNTFRPYISTGLILAFAKLQNEYYTTSNDEEFGPQKSIKHEKYTGGISLGMRGAIGLDFKLTESLVLFTEITFNSVSYYPKEKEVTKYEVDDENVLSTMTERDKRTVFIKKVSTDSRHDNPVDSKPSREQRISFGMSNLTTSAGLKIHL